MKLEIDNLKEGILKNINNAQELIDEAEILYENEKYARAYLLSHFAIEESSKCGMLLKIIAFKIWNEKIDIKTVRKGFINHKEKIKNFKLLEIFNENKIFDLKTEIGKLNDFKNQSIYVNWTNENEFIMPNEIFNKEMTEEMIQKSLEYVKLYTKISIQLINNEAEIFSTLKESKELKPIKKIIDYEKKR
ncbi:AbiV family abortive infection protein [Mesoflavibacter zeaxanthinifaciens]|uniref:AbiV family abortive infection protein n=1 Tax=Mesoflavibacter zeaxanthinifaciens TaxID=393060 RepID=UPI0026F32C66|nr:AbiV family abortive infection protein [Mesoflavibacter zeaxanthinifaciens]